MASLKDAKSHFRFGENWADFAKTIGVKQIEAAELGMISMFDREAIRGASFLDIGCGSGLHSLAAARLGAARVVAVDIDADSVSTTKALLARHHVSAEVSISSVFDLTAGNIGTFDIVYSWGVLHHTGDMYGAIRQAASLVSPGGLFGFALYRKTPLCAAWRVEKKLYTNAPRMVQKAMRGVYVAAIALGHSFRKRGGFRSYVDGYARRGMNFHHDVHDWMGGYPYESISPEEVAALMQSLGFSFVRANVRPRGSGLLAPGCDEYVYRSAHS